MHGRFPFGPFLLAALVGSAGAAAAHPAELKPVACEGTYKLHLQGVATGEEAIFWCFTDQLVKTDSDGKVRKQIAVPGHHGDLCVHDGKLYVAVYLRAADRKVGDAVSWVYEYDTAELRFIRRYPVDEAIHRAGGIAHHQGRFLIVGGLPEGIEENLVLEYDSEFRFVRKHALKSGHTKLGIQTATFGDGHWWFGCYDKVLLKADESLRTVKRFEFDCAMGIVAVSPGRFLVAQGGGAPQGRHTARLVSARPHSECGLVVESPASDDRPR